MPSHWPQISNSLPFLESLFELDSFEHKQQCALLISQLYYHLEDYDESIQYALEAGELFEVGKRNMYEECIVVKAIETYITLKQNQNQGININLKKTFYRNALLTIFIKKNFKIKLLTNNFINILVKYYN